MLLYNARWDFTFMVSVGVKYGREFDLHGNRVDVPQSWIPSLQVRMASEDDAVDLLFRSVAVSGSNPCQRIQHSTHISQRSSQQVEGLKITCCFKVCR